MFTDKIDELNINGNNYSAVRINHNLKNSRSSRGGAYIRRTSLAEASNDYIGVFAVDGTWCIGN